MPVWLAVEIMFGIMWALTVPIHYSIVHNVLGGAVAVAAVVLRMKLKWIMQQLTPVSLHRSSLSSPMAAGVPGRGNPPRRARVDWDTIVEGAQRTESPATIVPPHISFRSTTADNDTDGTHAGEKATGEMSVRFRDSPVQMGGATLAPSGGVTSGDVVVQVADRQAQQSGDGASANGTDTAQGGTQAQSDGSVNAASGVGGAGRGGAAAAPAVRDEAPSAHSGNRPAVAANTDNGPTADDRSAVPSPNQGAVRASHTTSGEPSSRAGGGEAGGEAGGVAGGESAVGDTGGGGPGPPQSLAIPQHSAFALRSRDGSNLSSGTTTSSGASFGTGPRNHRLFKSKSLHSATRPVQDMTPSTRAPNTRSARVIRATATPTEAARPGVSPHFQHPLRSFYAGHTKGTQPPYMSQPSEEHHRSWCGRKCLGRLPNRQERLFWFDRRGPEFMLFLVQMVVVLASFDIGAT